MKLIGLTGPKGSGKDTVADMLVERMDKTVKRSLAEPLYRMVAEMTGVGVEDLENVERKETPIRLLDLTPRYLLQTLGTEWGRNILGNDIWIRVLDRALEWDRDIGRRAVVVSDVRFANEAAWVRDTGVLVHIVRDATAYDQDDSHVSEAGVVRTEDDFVLFNTGSLDDLRSAVARLAVDIEARL